MMFYALIIALKKSASILLFLRQIPHILLQKENAETSEDTSSLLPKKKNLSSIPSGLKYKNTPFLNRFFSQDLKEKI